jgi:hypothetical protein
MMVTQSARHGFSQAASHISSIEAGQNRRFRQAQTFNRDSTIEELWDVWNSCKERNWDGFGAFPVSQDCYLYAAQLVRSLSYNFPAPSFGAEPDGELTIEWYKSPYRTISLSMTSDGHIHFSAIFGPYDFVNGTTAFNGELPSDIKALILKVLR